jgi:heme-degrading monooxygenase HmoA
MSAGAAVGINVFTLPQERHGELIDLLGGIADEADRQALPKNRLSSFHRALDAPLVVNFVEYSESSGGTATTAASKQLVARTHEISTAHEMRWYDKQEVVAAEGVTDAFEDLLGHGNVGVVGVYTVAPEKRSDLLHALKSYAEKVRSADGFKAMAILQGHKPEHAASYEIWTNDAAYRQAIAAGARAALEGVRGAAGDALIHAYEVVRVNRHKGGVHK